MTAILSRREEICDAIVDYVSANGVSDLSLRPLAEHLGTSPRMLLYHFNSKEQLLSEVLAAARARQYEMLHTWAAEGVTAVGIIRRYWDFAASEAARPYMRLFFEVYGLALQERPGTEGVLRDLTDQAVAFFQPAIETTGLAGTAANEVTRLALGVLRGLLFDLLATNDRAPLDAAFERFIVSFESSLSFTRREAMTTPIETVRAPGAVRVAPAHTITEWTDGKRLVRELVAWLAAEAGLDARAHQHDSNEELDDLPGFYRFPAGMLLVGYLGDEAVGTTGVHLMAPGVAELRRVWVTPTARGNRVAAELLASGIAGAKALGAERVWLESRRGPMDTAIGMYRRAGFEPIPPYTSLSENFPGWLSLGLVLR